MIPSRHISDQSFSSFFLFDLLSSVTGIWPGQGELLGKPALVATNHHSGLSCLSCPRADADGGPRKQQDHHTGCSDAVYLAVHPGPPDDCCLGAGSWKLIRTVKPTGILAG
jgi:hypothetical protein